MLFQDISILDENFQIQEHMYVTVQKDIISYIGTKAPQDTENEEIYQGQGKLLMPGFINAHSHAPMTLLRGYGENMCLADWLTKRIFPFEDKLQGKDVYYATLLSIAEMIRFGITSTSDMYYFCEDMVKAIDQGGIKCNLSRGTSCFDNSSFYDLPAYKEAKALYQTYHGSSNGRILIDMSLHAEYTSSERVAREISEFTKEMGAAMHVHLSETKDEHEQCKERHNGMTPAQYFYHVGLLDNRTNAAHCVYLEGEDFDIFKEKGVTVATCPKSNLKLASGVCNIKKLYEYDINVALGTDSVASNNNLNMLEEIKTFALIHKAWQHDPTVITPEQALQAATIAGAKAQGREHCGLIKENYKADVIVLDISAPYMQPIHHLMHNLIYSSCGTDVKLTMVDGKILYQDGVYKTIDLEKVIYEANCSKERILHELQ